MHIDILAKTTRGIAEEITRRNRTSDVTAAGEYVHQGSKCSTFSYAETYEENRSRFSKCTFVNVFSGSNLYTLISGYWAVCQIMSQYLKNRVNTTTPQK